MLTCHAFVAGSAYSQAEVQHILKELEPKKTSIQHVIDELPLHDNGL